MNWAGFPKNPKCQLGSNFIFLYHFHLMIRRVLPTSIPSISNHPWGNWTSVHIFLPSQKHLAQLVFMRTPLLLSLLDSYFINNLIWGSFSASFSSSGLWDVKAPSPGLGLLIVSSVSMMLHSICMLRTLHLSLFHSFPQLQTWMSVPILYLHLNAF